MSKPTFELVSDDRCLRTKNLCGTDTWRVGHPCECKNCQRYLRSLMVVEPEEK